MWNILSARLRLIAARLEKGIFLGIFFGAAGGSAYGSAGLGLTAQYMARVDGTRLQPLARVAETEQTVQNLQVARVSYLRLR